MATDATFHASKAQAAQSKGLAMEKVQGMGGLFFRARDPAALAAWYRSRLGIDPVPTGPDDTVWMQSAGPTVFSPFAADTDYLPADRQHMVNFRVADLDAMLAQLGALGEKTGEIQTMDQIGRFSRIHDPEGNPIELWEPAS